MPNRNVTSMKRESQILKNYLMSGAHSSAPLPLIYNPPHSSPVIKLNKMDGNHSIPQLTKLWYFEIIKSPPQEHKT